MNTEAHLLRGLRGTPIRALRATFPSLLTSRFSLPDSPFPTQAEDLSKLARALERELRDTSGSLGRVMVPALHAGPLCSFPQGPAEAAGDVEAVEVLEDGEHVGVPREHAGQQRRAAPAGPHDEAIHARYSNAMSHPDPGDPRIASGEAWDRFCERLRRSADRVLGEGVPDTPQLRAEGFRYLTRFLEAGIRSCVSHADPDYPVFGRMIEYTMPWGLDAPDCLYVYAAVRGDAAYRIEGWRGTANHIDIQVNAGHYAQGDVSAWETIDSISGRDLATDVDGRFALTLGGPRDGQDNWLALREDAGFVLIRQYFADWENEEPADLLIERVGAAYPIPVVRTDQVADRLALLETWLERGGALWERMSNSFLGLEPNSLIVHLPENADKHTGMAGQAYGIGNFHCRADEAVIVELEPPACHHWSVSLANYYWESIEYASRQTSLNGHQAVLDPDGVFRAVIAHEDPGVANWLDTGGHTSGSIAARFLLAESAPVPVLRAVSLGDLDTSLPEGAKRMDPATRREILARRRRAVLRRYRV